MAECLVRIISSTHEDPVIDAQCYKRGDIVAVMPDGHAWGRRETLPIFVKIKITGLDVETAKAWATEHVEDDPEDSVKAAVLRQRLSAILREDVPVKPRVMHRRLWRLRLNDLPTALRDELMTAGEITVTLGQLRQFIQHTVTMETA